LSRFLLDENIPHSVYKYLVAKGYIVEYVPRGAKNREVASLAKNRKFTLITRDSDFADPLLYPPEEYYGIIVLRIHPPTPRNLIKALDKALTMFSSFKGKTLIIYHDRIETIE